MLTTVFSYSTAIQDIMTLRNALYNGLISGVALDGGGFFYPNPLESIGQHQRQPRSVAHACPPNIARFIPRCPLCVCRER